MEQKPIDHFKLTTTTSFTVANQSKKFKDKRKKTQKTNRKLSTNSRKATEQANQSTKPSRFMFCSQNYINQAVIIYIQKLNRKISKPYLTQKQVPKSEASRSSSRFCYLFLSPQSALQSSKIHRDSQIGTSVDWSAAVERERERSNRRKLS